MMKLILSILIISLNLGLFTSSANHGCKGKFGDSDRECNTACKTAGYQIGQCDVYAQKCTCFGYYLPYTGDDSAPDKSVGSEKKKDYDYRDMFDQLIQDALDAEHTDMESLGEALQKQDMDQLDDILNENKSTDHSDTSTESIVY